MTIANSYKKAIYNAFLHTIFINRSQGFVLKALNTKVHGSGNVSIVPLIENVNIETIDETHDKMEFIFDDYSFEAVVTWKPCQNGRGVVFMNIE